MNGEIPDASWKRLTFEELKDYYANDPKEYSQSEKDLVIVLGHLVEKNKVRAFLKPDGKIAYQYNPDYTREAEEAENAR